MIGDLESSSEEEYTFDRARPGSTHHSEGMQNSQICGQKEDRGLIVWKQIMGKERKLG